MKRNPELIHKEQGLNLLDVSEWIPAGGGMLAARIVLVEWEPGLKWSTHTEIQNTDGSRCLHQGHYFHRVDDCGLRGAATDFEKRVQAQIRADRHCSQAEEMGR